MCMHHASLGSTPSLTQSVSQSLTKMENQELYNLPLTLSLHNLCTRFAVALHSFAYTHLLVPHTCYTPCSLQSLEIAKLSFNSISTQFKSSSSPVEVELALTPFSPASHPATQPPKKVVSKKVRVKTPSRLLQNYNETIYQIDENFCMTTPSL